MILIKVLLKEYQIRILDIMKNIETTILIQKMIKHLNNNKYYIVI